MLTAVQSIASSVGVAVFGSTFFHVIGTGSAGQAFQRCLYLQAGLLVVFLTLTYLFPKKGRPDEFPASQQADPATGDQSTGDQSAGDQLTAVNKLTEEVR